MRLRVITVQIATPDYGSSAETTDALNELFGENADLVVDWAYPKRGECVVEVEATSQEDYEEYSAFFEAKRKGL